MKHSELTKSILDSNGITSEKERDFFKELRVSLRLDYGIPAPEVRKLNDDKVIEKWYEIHSKPENRVGGSVV
jgi:hypothetical protein